MVAETWWSLSDFVPYPRWTAKVVAHPVSISSCPFGLARRDPEAMLTVCATSNPSLPLEGYRPPHLPERSGEEPKAVTWVWLLTMGDDDKRVTANLPLCAGPGTISPSRFGLSIKRCREGWDKASPASS